MMSVLKRVLGFGKPNLQHWCFRSSDHLPCGASQHDIDQGSLAMGQTNREIARAYHISIKTVDTYRARLLKKLGLRNNAELSRFAMQNQLIEP
jgi:hypothetical protein